MSTYKFAALFAVLSLVGAVAAALALTGFWDNGIASWKAWASAVLSLASAWGLRKTVKSAYVQRNKTLRYVQK